MNEGENSEWSEVFFSGGLTHLEAFFSGYGTPLTFRENVICLLNFLFSHKRIFLL